MNSRPRSWGTWFEPTASFAETTRLPAELSQPIATTSDGRDITQPWVNELVQARDPRLHSSVDWGAYDRILLDDQVKSCLEQRISAVVSRDWTVLSGEEGDPRADAAAAAFDDQIERVGWDRVTGKMLYAPFYGYAAAELMWGAGHDVLGWVPTKKCRPIHVRHARRFRFDQDGDLRLLTRAAPRGEPLPDRKFWIVTAGGSDDDTPYGRGLAEWLYWPTVFKRNGVRFWNTFLDKYSVPTAKGTYPRGTSREDIEKLLAALQAMSTDSGFVVPEGMAVELLDAAKAGVEFGEVCRYMDGAIAKIILSQTMTTDNGSSRSQAEVHADVKLEIVKADADLLSDSFNEGPARWWTDLNFGPDVASPRLVRIVEEEDDLKAAAETDEALNRLGWARDDESFNNRYGEGYVRKSAPAGSPAPAAKPGVGAPITEGLVATPIAVAAFATADPAPLYVYRQVKNAGAILAWAAEQGLTNLLPPDDLHVTIAYSRQPVSWFDVALDDLPGGELVVPPGGPRVIGQLGEQATVLMFANAGLSWRNRAMREAGASWDFPEYRPHVSLSYTPQTVDLDRVKPYQGRIVLGPEIFEPIDEEWRGQRGAASFAEPAPRPRDVVDDAVDAAMADDGWRPTLGAIVDPLVAALTAASSAEEVGAILSREAELGDDAPLAEALGRAAFATRIDAITEGAEG